MFPFVDVWLSLGEPGHNGVPGEQGPPGQTGYAGVRGSCEHW